MDLNIKGSIYDWSVESNIQLNSLNTERLGDSLRSKLIFNKRINLNEKVKVNKDLISDRDRFYFKRKETKDVSSIIGKQIEINRIKPFSKKAKKNLKIY